MSERKHLNDRIEQLAGLSAAFDRATYLALNPDVAEGVSNGTLRSAWDHFLNHGLDERRTGVQPRLYRKLRDLKSARDDAILPPGALRLRVHGADDAASYELIGRIVAANILGEMIAAGLAASGGRVLDFGCGPGRVLVPLSTLWDDMRLSDDLSLTGCDIDHEAIDWARTSLKTIGEFVPTSPDPPLPFEDEQFDFIYGISVFTHLPEDMQFRWLAELRRILSVGGHALLSTHGEELIGAGGTARCQLEDAGFRYEENEITEGLPAFYRSTFHTRSYLRERWGHYFQIVRIVPRGIAHYQDLVLCRRVS